MTDYHPPTGPEIAEHLEAGGRVEAWDVRSQTWCWSGGGVVAAGRWWPRTEPQPGYRLVPLPPKTERVMTRAELIARLRSEAKGKDKCAQIGGLLFAADALEADAAELKVLRDRIADAEDLMRAVRGGYVSTLLEQIDAFLDLGTIEVLVEGPE